MSTDPLQKVLERIEGRVVVMAQHMAELEELTKKALKLIGQLQELWNHES